MRKRSDILDWFRDADGNYFPWLKELWAALRKQDEELIARTGTSTRLASEFDKPRLSNVVACMEQIRATPELWEPLSELAEQYIKTGQISDDDSKGISHLIGRFTAWFQLKNGTDESSYSLIAGILFDLETGRLIATDDVDAARKGFFGNIVDDLSPKEERNA